MSTPKVIAFPLAPLNTIYPSHAYAGLSELAYKGEIKLYFGASKKLLRFADNRNDGRGGFGRTVYFEVGDREKMKILIDFNDTQALTVPQALEECDFYFKRSFTPSGYENKRVMPYGLYYTTSSPHEKSLIKRALCANHTRGFWKSNPRKALKNIQSALTYRKNRPNIPTSRELTNDVSSKILFQTRLFAPGFRSVDPQNSQRCELVRRLRDEFQDLYRGGIIEDHNSNLVLPDPELLSTENTDPQNYYSLIRQHPICISTVGIGTSTPCKIAEYLGMGRCIISNPILDQLPVPLEHGKNILFYETPEECIQLCKEMLEDADKRHRIQQAAREYFVSHASPEATMRRVLHQVSKEI